MSSPSDGAQTAIERIDDFLTHPLTARLSAIQTIVGAAMFATGIVGGLVSLALDFSAGWTAISAVGVFLLISGLVTSVLMRSRDGGGRPRRP